MTHFEGRDFVSIDHFTTDEINYLLDGAKKYKEMGKGAAGALSEKLGDRTVALAFFEDSTRTRLSSERAAEILDAHVFGFAGPEGTSLKKNESIHHTLEMLWQYGAEAIVMRNNWDGAAQYAADRFEIPIINAGDGKHEHPTQTVLDLFTIKETQGRLDNLKIAMVGDLKYGRTVHSLIKAMRRWEGNTFYLVNPPQLQMPSEYTTSQDGNERGDVFTGLSLENVLNICDIVYVTRVQKERIEDERERKEVLGKLQINPLLLEQAKPKKNMKLLHPLPIDADNPEIEKSVYRTNPQQAYFFQQAGNGIYARMMILLSVFGLEGKDFSGKAYKTPERSDKNSFIELPISASAGKSDEERMIYSLHNGTVIDHIPDDRGYMLAQALQLDRLPVPTILARGLSTKRNEMGRKSLIKMVNRALTPEELNTIGIICPDSTVSIIIEGKVSQKYKVQLPDVVAGLLQCQNTGCVSNNPREDAPSRFYTLARSPAALLSCHYCDTLHAFNKGNIKLQPR